MKTCLFLFVLLIVPKSLMAQDTLVLKDGRMISCKITEIDSSNVYFDIHDKNQKIVHTIVNQNSIQEIKHHPDVESVNGINSMNSIGILFGLSLPSGDFADDDINREESGLAGNGINFSAVFTHYFNQLYGLSVKGFYNNNILKADLLGDFMSSMLGMQVTNNTVKYGTFGFLAGPSVLLPVDRLSLAGHFMCGYANLTEPEVTFTVTSATSYAWIKMSKIIKGSFMANIGGGLVCTVNENWNLFANVDYFGGSFKFEKYTMSYSSGESEKYDRGTQKYGVINISAGIELKF